MNCALLHFGCGSLGLGLVVEQFSALSRVDIFLVNRRSSSGDSRARNDSLIRNHNYIVRKPSAPDCTVSFKSFLYDDETGKINDLVLSDRVLFLTTSLKDGLRPSIPILAEVVHARNNAGVKCPLICVACENAISTTHLKEEILVYLRGVYGDGYALRREIVFLDAVVDRICNHPVVEDDTVITHAEQYGSWIISAAALNELDEMHAQYITETLQEIQAVDLDSDIDFYIRRKKWLFNSVHQLIAILAYYNDYVDLDGFTQTPFGQQALQEIADEIRDVYLHNDRHADFMATEAFLKDTVSRISQVPYLATNAIARFKSTGDLPEFFKDFQRKIGSPADAYLTDTGERIFWIPFVLLKLTDLVAKQKFVNIQG